MCNVNVCKIIFFFLPNLKLNKSPEEIKPTVNLLKLGGLVFHHMQNAKALMTINVVTYFMIKFKHLEIIRVFILYL